MCAMPYAAGTGLGPFEILGPLEVVGLGEVYRARDHEHGRNVAMRVLPADFGGNPDLLARFEREARAAALVSHPNILAIHDIGTDAGAAYIISEPIDGRTLREVLRGGPLPVQAVIQYAVQMAHGLAAAHDAGIVHRDLKPENVLVGADGRVRIVGFGLAAATQVESALAGLKGASPGTTLGAPGYMSPEQVRGVPPDPRSDMFTFGAIVHEMVTGSRAFSGDTPLETMTAVAKSDPPKLPAELQVPPALARTIDLCLKKKPGGRPAASDVARVLHDVWQQTTAPAPTPVAPEPVAVSEPMAAPMAFDVESPAADSAIVPRRRRLVPILVGLGVLAVVALLVPGMMRVLQTAWLGTVGAPASNAPSAIATMTMPDRPVGEFALSPDGQRVAFTAADSNGQRWLWVRSLTATGEQPLPGTEGAAFPFWSPDSRFIAYFAQGALRKIAAEGGAPVVLADATASSAGAWGSGDVIVFQREASGGPLYRVDADGGTPSPVTGLRSGESAHTWPVLLADGQRFLYTVVPADDEEPSVQVGSLESMDRQPVLSNASRAALIPDYVFFLRENALTVQPFDAGSLQTRGDALPIGGGRAGSGGDAVRAFSISSAGVLAYQTGPPADPARSRLVWLDRTGAESGTVGEPADYGDVSLSPDGTRVAVSIREPGSDAGDIALVEIESGMRTPLTSDPADDSAPVWSPDGRRIAYASTRQGSTDIYQKAVTGTGSDVVIVDGRGDQIAYDWSQNSRYLLYQTNQPGVAAGGNYDLWARMLPGGPSFAYFSTVRTATLPKLSPDGRWVAYSSVEGGREDVYVSRFPSPSGRRRVSARGGSWPRWRRDGEELLYVDLDDQLMAVPVTPGSAQEFGEASPLFQLRAKRDRGYAYDVSADGQRILANMAGEGESARPMRLVDWRAQLQR